MTVRRAAWAAAVLCALAVGQGAAAAPAPAAGAAADDLAHYQVRQGDTLYALAEKYLIRPGDYRAVQRANRVRNPRRLVIGSDLAIPVEWLRTEPIEAVVETLSGEATVTTQGRISALAKGAVLRQGDTVATQANAFVRLALPDATHMTLPSQSRLRIEALHRVLLTGAVVRGFALEKGRSESVVTPMKQPQDRFVVRTPLSIAAVRGTEFRVSFDEGEQRAGVGVLDGAVGVAPPAGGDGAVVQKSFGVSADRDGVSQPRPLLPAPVLKDSSNIQQAPAISLELEPVEGAQAYRAQLAADAGLLNPIAETLSDQPRLSFPELAEGQWFVKLTAIDSGGLEGAPRIYGFERILNDVNQKAPTSSGQRRRQQWLFRWESHGSGKPSYRFQLFGETDGAAPIIDAPGLERPEITIQNLPQGVYRWRVESILTRNGRAYEVWSPLQEFRIGR